MAIFSRLPRWSQVAAVYSVIVLVIYSWTLLWFFWKFPSWLYFLSLWEIIKVLCYAIVTNLLESLVVMLPLLALAIILPRRWFADGFVAHSVPAVVLGLGYMMYLASQFQGKEDYPSGVIRLMPLVLVAMMLAALLGGKIKPLRSAIEGFADRATIFLYILIPLSLACLLVVLAQWII